MLPESAPTTGTISSGNPELDSRMGGGLPLKSLILVEGRSGTGKSVLTQQITYGALNQGLRVSMITSENTVQSLINQMESIDLHIRDFVLLRRMLIYPVEFSQIGTQAVSHLLHALAQERSDLLIIDSLSAVAAEAKPSTIIQFFETAKQLCDRGKTILVTLHPQDPAMMEQLRSLCDANLALQAERDGQRIVKMLQVTKIRGASAVTGAIVGFEVEPGWGMRVIPISKARG